MAERDAAYCQPGFRYNSSTNDVWLTVEELRKLIKQEMPEYQH